MRERRGGELRLEAPPGVVEIARRLERAGHETWCVGGGVRDALLGHPQLDWDLANRRVDAERHLDCLGGVGAEVELAGLAVALRFDLRQRAGLVAHAAAVRTDRVPR